MHEPNVAASSPEMFIDPRLLTLNRTADAATTTVTVTAQPTPEIDNFLVDTLSTLQHHATDTEAVVVASSSTASDTDDGTLLLLQQLAKAARDSALPESK